MYTRLGMLFVVLAVIALVIKLLRSPKFDKWCDNMAEGKLEETDSTKDAIKDIVSTEKNLSKKADTNIKNAEKLTAESENINDFLGKRNNSGTDKKEDS